MRHAWFRAYLPDWLRESMRLWNSFVDAVIGVMLNIDPTKQAKSRVDLGDACAIQVRTPRVTNSISSPKRRWTDSACAVRCRNDMLRVFLDQQLKHTRPVLFVGALGDTEAVIHFHCQLDYQQETMAFLFDSGGFRCFVEHRVEGISCLRIPLTWFQPKYYCLRKLNPAACNQSAGRMPHLENTTFFLLP